MITIPRRKWRENILTVIANEPGIESGEIRKRVDPLGLYDRCIIAHILTGLFRDGHVARNRVIGRKCITYSYFLNIEGREMSIPEKAINFVQQNPGRTAAEISAAIGLTSYKLCAILRSASRAGEVVAIKNGNSQIFSYYPKGFEQGADAGVVANDNGEDMPVSLPPREQGLIPNVSNRFNEGLLLAAHLCKVHARDPSLKLGQRELLEGMAGKISALQV